MSTPIPEHKSCFLHGDHDEERSPRCARLPRVCRHAIYHHGCPSCDYQDPEDRLLAPPPGDKENPDG